MSRTLIAALAATLSLYSPVIAGQAIGNDPASFVNGCWSGVNWDEHGIKDEFAINAR